MDATTLHALMLAAALGVAAWWRPWRALDAPPVWPWLAWWAAMPLMWSVDQLLRLPLALPLSGMPLLVLMLDWPLALLALAPVTAMAATVGGLGWDEALARAVWLGVVPAAVAAGLGWALVRWLPHHLFIYILGRGFFTTTVALTLAGALSTLRADVDGVVLARFLLASGEAFLTGMLTAIFVAFRPHWLRTWSDGLYLQRRSDT